MDRLLELIPAAVTDKGLKGLSKYKYSAFDLSPISKYILSHYWTWAATLFPIWMAPNLITALGFVFVLVNFGILLFYIPDLESVAPSWVYFSFAFGLWMYSTFDNVDGKQARRTGTSSPLGELFDHGVDALNCTTGGLIQAGGVALGCSHWTLLVIAIASNAFFFATWETYYTGSMYLGVINGPTEGLLITIATLIISGIYGPLVWKLPLKTILPTSVLNYFTQLKVIASSLTLAQAAIFGMLAMFLTIQLPVCLYRVYVACKRKNISFVQPLLQAGIFIVFLLIATAWTFAPTTTLIPAHVIVYSLAWGLAAGKINALIILCHVTHVDYPTYFSLIAPFAVGSFISWAPSLFKSSLILDAKVESIFVWVMFIYLFLNYWLWAIKVIDQISKHLGIKCFVIPYPKQETTKKSPLAESPKKALETPTRKGRKKVAESTTATNSPLIELITKDDFESPRRVTRSASKKLK